MTRMACALLVLFAIPQAVGDVESRFDKSVDFSALRTYAWSKGNEAYRPDVHKAIVAAVDAQMSGLGFTQGNAGSANVLVRYDSVRSSDVDLATFEKLHKEGKDTAASAKVLGRLAIIFADPKSGATLWTALGRRRLSEDPAKLNDEVKLVVAALFEKYPGRKKMATEAGRRVAGRRMRQRAAAVALIAAGLAAVGVSAQEPVSPAPNLSAAVSSATPGAAFTFQFANRPITVLRATVLSRPPSRAGGVGDPDSRSNRARRRAGHRLQPPVPGRDDAVRGADRCLRHPPARRGRHGRGDDRGECRRRGRQPAARPRRSRRTADDRGGSWSAQRWRSWARCSSCCSSG